MKLCPKCGETLPEGKFSKNRTSKDGLQSWCKSCINNQKLLREYGIDAEDFKRLHDEQSGRCALCNCHGSGRKGLHRLVVDHNHKTGRVRALLCHPCNVALGLLKDDPKLMNRAASYVEKHS